MHSISNAGEAVGRITPKNSETETTFAPSLGPGDQTKSDSSHRSGETPHDQGYGKRLASVTAKLAMLGFELHPLTGEQLLVGRWNMSRTLASVEAAERFLVMVGGAV